MGKILKIIKESFEKINSDKKIALVILGVVFVIGIFLRTYQYHDWLYFKWDQARDATLVSKAIENGPGELPLLGPRATRVGEDYLRLGPAFYYSQYLSGAIFSSTKPDVFAYPDTFFAILTIPLLYLFVRLYFSRSVSLLITTLYAFGFLIVEYSRFAWNPNAVPFFTLLSFYAFIQLFRQEVYERKLIWLAVAVAAIAIDTQYHFFAMFALIAILPLFLVIHLKMWQKIFWKNFFRKVFSKKTIGYILVPLFIFGLVYTPVIVSDAKTGWSNSKNFVGAFTEKPKDKPLGQKIVRNFREQAKNYTLIATSFWTRKGKKSDPYPVIFGLFFMASGVLLAWYLARKTSKKHKRAFLVLLGVWIVAYFLITIPTSYQLRPRYFAFVFPVPFIILGLWMKWLIANFKKWGLFFAIVVFGAFFLMNVYGVAAWYKDNYISQKRDFPTDRNFILKKDDGITLGQMERVVDYMYENREGNKVVFYSKAEYSLPIEYLLLEKNKNLEIYFIADTTDLAGHDWLYAVNTVKGGFDSVSKKVKNYAGMRDQGEEFGEMVVFKLLDVDQEKVNELVLKKEELAKEQEEDENEDSIEGENEDEGKTERLFWKDVL